MDIISGNVILYAWMAVLTVGTVAALSRNTRTRSLGRFKTWLPSSIAALATGWASATLSAAIGASSLATSVAIAVWISREVWALSNRSSKTRSMVDHVGKMASALSHIVVAVSVYFPFVGVLWHALVSAAKAHGESHPLSDPPLWRKWFDPDNFR